MFNRPLSQSGKINLPTLYVWLKKLRKSFQFPAFLVSHLIEAIFLSLKFPKKKQSRLIFEVAISTFSCQHRGHFQPKRCCMEKIKTLPNLDPARRCSYCRLYLGGTHSLETGTEPPSCLLLENHLYMLIEKETSLYGGPHKKRIIQTYVQQLMRYQSRHILYFKRD